VKSDLLAHVFPTNLFLSQVVGSTFVNNTEVSKYVTFFWVVLWVLADTNRGMPTSFYLLARVVTMKLEKVRA